MQYNNVTCVRTSSYINTNRGQNFWISIWGFIPQEARTFCAFIKCKPITQQLYYRKFRTPQDSEVSSSSSRSIKTNELVQFKNPHTTPWLHTDIESSDTSQCLKAHVIFSFFLDSCVHRSALCIFHHGSPKKQLVIFTDLKEHQPSLLASPVHVRLCFRPKFDTIHLAYTAQCRPTTPTLALPLAHPTGRGLEGQRNSGDTSTSYTL